MIVVKAGDVNAKTPAADHLGHLQDLPLIISLSRIKKRTRQSPSGRIRKGNGGDDCCPDTENPGVIAATTASVTSLCPTLLGASEHFRFLDVLSKFFLCYPHPLFLFSPPTPHQGR